MFDKILMMEGIMTTEVIGDNTNTDSNPQDSNPKEEFVSKKAYQQVSDDMHKYKARLKDLEAKYNETVVKIEDQERANYERLKKK